MRKHNWKKDKATLRQIKYASVLLDKMPDRKQAILDLFDISDLSSISKGKANAIISYLELALKSSVVSQEEPEHVYPYYAVFTGKQPGIYESLATARDQQGQYQGFCSLKEAREAYTAFLNKTEI